MLKAERPAAKTGDRIDPGVIAEALTRAPLTYTDGATQVFAHDSRTTYTENGQTTSGTWGVDDEGQFWSFWPPTYRAVYDVFWITGAEGDAVGVQFTELNRGVTSEGRYISQLTSSAG